LLAKMKRRPEEAKTKGKVRRRPVCQKAF